ncbi:hypothetical protein CUMW_122850 [Citrus unshiu]|uniref:Uncharacterized protein n=1 Tax=Citrus unshiu TaxID=55188 RepID=A0A2H5PC43_CITUN|nr:hypothetical protein CUMW_122850 [Citrus unshiu]
MKIIRTALVAFCALILVHFLMASLLCINHEGIIHPRDRNRPRRLLVSAASLSANLSKLDEAVKDPHKAVKTSLRKAPASNGIYEAVEKPAPHVTYSKEHQCHQVFHLF